MGTGATVTLGVSLAVPEPYGTVLQERRASFGDTAAHGIPTHITLLPPTEVRAAARPAIEAHLARVALGGRPFTMRLSGTGTFRPLSPVVFVQVVEGVLECSRLQEQVRDPQGPLARELAFPYHPHVTVAHGIDDAAMDRADAELSGFEASWTAAGFALYLQGEDCVWRLQREFAFGRSEGVPPVPPAAGTGTGPATLGGTPHTSAPASAAGPASVPHTCRPPATL